MTESQTLAFSDPQHDPDRFNARKFSRLFSQNIGVILSVDLLDDGYYWHCSISRNKFNHGVTPLTYWTKSEIHKSLLIAASELQDVGIDSEQTMEMGNVAVHVYKPLTQREHRALVVKKAEA